MTVVVQSDAASIRIIDLCDEVPAATRSSLRLYGLRKDDRDFFGSTLERPHVVLDVVNVLIQAGVDVELDRTTNKFVQLWERAQQELELSQEVGGLVKEGNLEGLEVCDFVRFARSELDRPLLPHQLRGALHLLNVSHGANFSTPGAGKTSVVVAVYEFLRRKDLIDSLFVVGPRSCFQPWQDEFEATLGRRPKFEIFAGGDVQDRHSKYYSRISQRKELYLTTYQTLSRDIRQAQDLLQEPGNRAFFVADESHYMKQGGGVWARSVSDVSKFGAKRCIMTGTPFPRNYVDGLSQLDILYPNARIFAPAEEARIKQTSESGRHDAARAILEPKIRNLFYRVRKRDLQLSDPVFLTPTKIEMNPIERELYDCIVTRISELSERLDDLDFATSLNLQRGRQIRKRQAVSYCGLLLGAIDDYSEELIDPENLSLVCKVKEYERLEVPGKMETLTDMLRDFSAKNEKVVVWANFVGTLFRINRLCDEAGLQSKVVYGGTPAEDGASMLGDQTREKIIEVFKDADSGLDLLIANPAACAESISLHKTCSNAIYYDLSYNCAEYLQSLDRIHRVGGSEDKVSFYHFLQYQDTFEAQILENLVSKTERMLSVIDRDFPLASEELPELGVGLDEHP